MTCSKCACETRQCAWIHIWALSVPPLQTLSTLLVQTMASETHSLQGFENIIDTACFQTCSPNQTCTIPQGSTYCGWAGAFASVFKYPSTFFVWAKKQGTNIVTQCLIVVTSSSSFGCLLSLLIFALTFTSLKIMLKICPEDWRPCVRALRPLKICGPLTENPAVEGPLYLISCQPLLLPSLNSRRIFKNGGRQEWVQCLMWNRPGLGSQLERGWESSGNKGSQLAGWGHRGARSPVKCEAHPLLLPAPYPALLLPPALPWSKTSLLPICLIS